jgi:hypothetical protein
MLLVLALGLGGRALAQEEEDRRALGRDLAHLMLDDPLRRELNEQVTTGLTLAVGSTLPCLRLRRESRAQRRDLEGRGRGARGGGARGRAFMLLLLPTPVVRGDNGLMEPPPGRGRACLGQTNAHFAGT